MVNSEDTDVISIPVILQLGGVQFKARNEGTYLGILWYLLNPIMMFAVALTVAGHRRDLDPTDRMGSTDD